MNIKFYKKVVALTAVGTVLASPIASYAEQQEGNKNHPAGIHQQSNTDQLQVSDEQALRSIEESFAGVDGRGISEEEVMDKVEPPKEEIINSARSSSAINKGDISGVPFKQWIVPKGNSNIRPGYYMKPTSITIHETDNPSVGAGARNHAQYLYNQAVGATDRRASWHYTVDDKEIYQHLPINENGWHAGDGNGAGNRQSIAIEIAVNKDGDYDKAVENAQKLVSHLMKQTGISSGNIVKHQKWSGKNCPSIMISRGAWGSFVEGVNAISNGSNNNNNGSNITSPGESKKTIQIDGIGVNIRSGAGTNHSVVRKATKGEKATVLREQNGWLEIKSGQWVFYDSSYIKYVDQNGNSNNNNNSNNGNGNENQVKKSIQVNGIGVNVRSGAGTNHSIVRKVNKGEKLDVYEEKNGWMRVGNGQWIYNDSSYIQVLNSGGNNNNNNSNNGNGNGNQVKKSIQVNGIGVNIRSGAGTNNTVVRKANKGEKLDVYEEKNGWMRVGNGQWIYNDSSYIKDLTQGGNSGGQTIKTAHINGVGVNIRSGAGTGYSVIRKAKKGEKISVKEEKNGWLRISDREWVYYDSSYIKYN
ncbi:N-acetylmuramoyl-L-alanine amidase [Bacillus cereus]|nr:N-acetylmuramoyl-L-alanine amidase [Bacillus cereus]